MFTGIIEEVGTVTSISDSGGFRTIRLEAKRVLEDTVIGSSIAVNGVCLTAISVDSAGFAAQLSRETLDRTSLNRLETGSLVNLERPMRADGRFGGHIVQGHVDGIGRIAEFQRGGDDWNLEIEFPAADARHVDARYMVEKGSITVDGISLTIAAVHQATFAVAIIPHTLDNTNLKRARRGDAVNLEFDVVAKYIERLMAARTEK